MALLEINNLEVHYGVIHALKGISFEVNEGEIIALIGANGAGKTTTLHTISGILQASSGNIIYDGKDITKVQAHKIVNLGISQVPEGRRVFAQLSVLENLKLGAFIRKDKDGIEEDLRNIYERFPRLEERKNQLAGTLSGGEQQMLAMGRALMSRPRIILMDEPSMGLSPIYVSEIFDIIKSINKDGTTVLLVEQNAKKALSIADRAYVLETGMIALSGDAKNLMNDDTVKKHISENNILENKGTFRILCELSLFFKGVVNMRHSLKIKLTLIMASLVTAVVVLICVLNTTMFEKFYIKSRQNDLKDAYSRLTDVLSVKNTDSTVVQDTINQINYGHNINVFVLDGRWNIAYSSQTGYEDVVRWIQDINFNPNVQKKILEENSEYTIVQSFDSATSMSYIVATGILSDGSQIIMQTTIESMQENISTYNRFVIFIGTGILLVSIIIVYIIAIGVTKPVKKLSEIAEEVSDMNFDAKYEGSDKGEIGVLGNSINVMSAKLERNISELKMANMELMKDNEIKTRNDEMRREFLGNVSHELKTPIALIQGYAEGLKEGINDDEESRNFYCDVIMDEAVKMNNMVKKLLTLNQIESGNDKISIERFDLVELAGSVIRANGIVMNQKEITVDFKHPDTAEVWADQIQMEEVFTNYLTNAVNHCDGDRKIIITIEKKQNSVYASVYNTGHAIPEEDIERIWEKFYKVDKARTREYGGNGIGLSIVKAILDNYKASYGARNLKDGVEFWFDMPVHEV